MMPHPKSSTPIIRMMKRLSSAKSTSRRIMPFLLLRRLLKLQRVGYDLFAFLKAAGDHQHVARQRFATHHRHAPEIAARAQGDKDPVAIVQMKDASCRHDDGGRLASANGMWQWQTSQCAEDCPGFAPGCEPWPYGLKDQESAPISEIVPLRTSLG